MESSRPEGRQRRQAPARTRRTQAGLRVTPAEVSMWVCCKLLRRSFAELCRVSNRGGLIREQLRGSTLSLDPHLQHMLGGGAARPLPCCRASAPILERERERERRSRCLTKGARAAVAESEYAGGRGEALAMIYRDWRRRGSLASHLSKCTRVRDLVACSGCSRKGRRQLQGWRVRPCGGSGSVLFAPSAWSDAQCTRQWDFDILV